MGTNENETIGDIMNNANAASTQPTTRLTWLAAAVFLAFPGAFMIPAVTRDADAAVGQQGVDQSSWKTVRVPHAHLSVKVPGTWGAFELSKFPKPSHGTILFARGSGQGDSFIVTRFRGAGAYWFKDFNEFRNTVDASLKLGDAKLLRATKTKVGPDLRTFRSRRLSRAMRRSFGARSISRRRRAP
jgi:hypothetical protein